MTESSRFGVFEAESHAHSYAIDCLDFKRPPNALFAAPSCPANTRSHHRVPRPWFRLVSPVNSGNLPQLEAPPSEDAPDLSTPSTPSTAHLGSVASVAPAPPRDFVIEHCAKQGVSNAGSSPAGGGFFPYTNLHSKVS